MRQQLSTNIGAYNKKTLAQLKDGAGGVQFSQLALYKPPGQWEMIYNLGEIHIFSLVQIQSQIEIVQAQILTPTQIKAIDQIIYHIGEPFFI